MQLNIREMLVGHPVRLRYVYRFSTSRVQHPETVAEHSYYVAFYSLMIGRWAMANWKVNGPVPCVNISTLLTRALVHDIEEARSGDFPRPFKHSDPVLATALGRASGVAFNQVMLPMLGISQFLDEMQDAWSNAKDDSVEGRILEFADFLCVLSFMHEEIGAGGNRSIENHVKDMGLYFDKFTTREYEFIAPLVDQAQELMLEVFPRKGV